MNAFHAMNLELMKSETATDGEISLLRYTAQERQQLSARISHLLTGMFMFAFKSICQVFF